MLDAYYGLRYLSHFASLWWRGRLTTKLFVAAFLHFFSAFIVAGARSCADALPTTGGGRLEPARRPAPEATRTLSVTLDSP